MQAPPKARTVALATGLLLFCLMLAVVLSFIVAKIEADNVSRSTQHDFCDIINLDVSALKQPKPPPGHPSRTVQYNAYIDLLQLQHKFGC